MGTGTEAKKPWIRTAYAVGSGQNGLAVLAQCVTGHVEIQAADDPAAPLPMRADSLACLAPADARRLAAALMKAADVAERGRGHAQG